MKIDHNYNYILLDYFKCYYFLTKKFEQLRGGAALVDRPH